MRDLASTIASNVQHRPLGPALICGVLYASSAATTVQWGDSARLSQQILDRDVPFDLGIGGHPLHTIAGIGWAKLLSFLPVASAANLLSSFFGAVAVGFVAASIYSVTRSIRALWFGSALLAVAHTHWFLSSICESYTLGAVILSAGYWAMARSEAQAMWAALAGGLLALAPLANSYPALAWPGLLVWALLLERDRIRRITFLLVGSTAGALVTIACYAYAVGLVGVAGNLQGQVSTFARAHNMLRQLAETPLIMGFQFASPALAWLMWRQRAHRPPVGAWAALLGALCISLFASTYLRQKQFEILIGSTVLLAIALGAWIGDEARPRWTIFHASWVAAFLYLSPFVVGSIVGNMLSARPAPGRDAAYFLRPWKRGKDSADQWAREVLESAPPQTTIVADYTLSRVLRFVNTSNHLRRDVKFIETDSYMQPDPDGIHRHYVMVLNDAIASGPVVLAQDYEPYYFISEVRQHFDVSPCGPVYCLARHAKGAPR